MRRLGVPRRVVKWAGGTAILAILGVVGINLVMLFSTRGSITTVARARHAQTAIVLGALVYPSGQMSPMLADRVADGLALYREGAVNSVLVSGDHGKWT